MIKQGCIFWTKIIFSLSHYSFPFFCKMQNIHPCDNIDNGFRGHEDSDESGDESDNERVPSPSPSPSLDFTGSHEE